MTTQNYCMIQIDSGICENVVMWNGDTDTWAPPPNYLMLVQSNVAAKVWSWNSADQVWLLSEQQGVGGIGFTWDGTYLTTGESMPTTPPVAAGNQPNSTGSQPL